MARSRLWLRPQEIWERDNNHKSDNKIGRPRSWSPIFFVTSMITDRIGRHEVLLPINHKNYNFREKMNSQGMKERENLYSISL